jgi:hypothetical protein
MTTGNGSKSRVDRIGQGNDLAQAIQIKQFAFDKIVTFSNVGAAVEFSGTPIAGLPRGDIIIVGGHLHLTASKVNATLSANIIDAFILSYALGTVATVNNSLADATDFNLKTAVTLAAATAGVSPNTSGVLNGIVPMAMNPANAYVDNNAGTLAVFLNMTLPDASVTGSASSLRVKGLLKLATIGFGKNS